MGIRYRKSAKIGPLRINLSKSGVGYSVGTKGFRYTKKANGGTRTTTSIPGTGISYVKDSKKTKRGSTMKYHGKFESVPDASQNSNNLCKPDNMQDVTLVEVLLAWFLGCFGGHKYYRKKIGIGLCYLFTFGLFCIGWLGDAIWLTIQYLSLKRGNATTKAHKYGSYVAGVLCLIVLVGCSGTNDNAPSPTGPIATEGVVICTTEAETSAPETAAPITVPETIAPTTDVETTTPSTEYGTNPATEPKTEPETEQAAEPEIIASPTAQSTQPQEALVWIPTNGGSKYHRTSSCSNMADPEQVTISQAIARGFEPCKRCY